MTNPHPDASDGALQKDPDEWKTGDEPMTGAQRSYLDTLAREGVNIDMISTSEIKVSVVLDLAKAEQAMRAVHTAFLGSATAGA